MFLDQLPGLTHTDVSLEDRSVNHVLVTFDPYLPFSSVSAGLPSPPRLSSRRQGTQTPSVLFCSQLRQRVQRVHRDSSVRPGRACRWKQDQHYTSCLQPTASWELTET